MLVYDLHGRCFHNSQVNLSDIFDYMDGGGAEELLQFLGKVLRAGGKVVYWNLNKISLLTLPNETFTEIRDQASELYKLDRSVFYESFNILVKENK